MIRRQLADAELVAEGLAFPEGPIAMSDRSVLLVEIDAGRLTRVMPDGATDVVAQLGGGPNGAAIRPRRGGVHVQQRSDATRPIPARNSARRSRNRCLDMALHRVRRSSFSSGRTISCSTPMWFLVHRPRRRHSALRACGRIGSQHRVACCASQRDRLSPAGDFVYWAQTTTRQVLSRRISAPGVLEPWFGSDSMALVRKGAVDPFALLVGLPGAMELDSLAIDSSGAICVGTLIDGGITEIPADHAWPDSSDGIIHWELPEHLYDGLVTNICFGGDDLITAYLTCSHTGRLVPCTWHRSGLALAYGI